MRLSYLIVFALMLSFSACYQPYYTLSDLPEERIEFGTGVDGEPTECFTLLRSGQVLKQNINLDTFFQVKLLDRSEVRAIFYQRDSIRLLSYDLFDASSDYMFINQFEPRIEHNISWASTGNKAPESIEYFFDLLIEATRIDAKGKKPLIKDEKGGKSESFGW
jgi:hypothetical protein